MFLSHNISKKRNAFLFRLLVCSVFILAAGNAAHACRCVKRTLKQHYQSAGAVVLAKVIEINPKGENVTEIKLEVFDSWKSNVTQTLTISTGSTTCDIRVNLNEEHLFYLKKLESGDWTTNICSGNLSKSKAANARKWLKSNAKVSIIKPV